VAALEAQVQQELSEAQHRHAELEGFIMEAEQLNQTQLERCCQAEWASQAEREQQENQQAQNAQAVLQLQLELSQERERRRRQEQAAQALVEYSDQALARLSRAGVICLQALLRTFDARRLAASVHCWRSNQRGLMPPREARQRALRTLMWRSARRAQRGAVLRWRVAQSMAGERLNGYMQREAENPVIRPHTVIPWKGDSPRSEASSLTLDHNRYLEDLREACSPAALGLAPSTARSTSSAGTLQSGSTTLNESQQPPCRQARDVLLSPLSPTEGSGDRMIEELETLMQNLDQLSFNMNLDDDDGND